MGGGGGGSQASMRHLTNIFRRVYRIFAHAWFQHRGVFWHVEGHEGLYIFFKTVCDVYQLIPEDNYTIPNEAEGGDSDTLETPVGTKTPDMGRMSVLQKNGGNGQSHSGENPEGEATTTVSVGATTRRHKHTPSTGSHVTTIAESYEEEEPSSNDSEVKDSPKRSAPSLGRPVPLDENTIVNGLGNLSLGDLSATRESYGPAEQPTPQPHNMERNPMEDAGKPESPAGLADKVAAEAAMDAGGEKDKKKDEEARQILDTDDLSKALTSGEKSSVEPTVTVEGKHKREKLEDDDITEGATDESKEKIESETNKPQTKPESEK